MKEFSTEDLRHELAMRGYQTANLWHIDDVLQKYDCCDEDAMDVLREVFNSEYVREVIFDIIDEVCNQEGIEKKES
jgi:hypothetical protein